MGEPAPGANTPLTPAPPAAQRPALPLDRSAPPPLQSTFISRPISVAEFQREAVSTWRALRDAVGSSRDGGAAEVEALALDDVLVPTVLDAVRTLQPPLGLFPAPPLEEDDAPPGVVVAAVGSDFTLGEATATHSAAELVRVRDSRAAALEASPLQCLRALSPSERRDRVITGGVKRRRGVVAGQPRPHGTPPVAASAAIVVADDTVVTFALFFRSMRPKREYLGQEVQCLGSYTLAQLRDALSCPSDASAAQFRAATPGAFFYIEGVFYNDLRKDGATDLSKPLLDFAKTSPLEIVGEGARSHTDGTPLPLSAMAPGGPLAVGTRDRFRAASMEDTRIRDLTLRVGATYVYTHQGDCEHALRVTDIRLATSAELAVAPGGAFPATTYKLPRQVRKCAICEMATAIKVVYNSRLAPESPCFFCQDCFQRLHYSADNKLLFSDFEVYDV